MSKTCVTCRKTKGLEHFYRSSTNKDGLQNRCKDCGVSSAREWEAANPDRVKELNSLASKRWRERNPEKQLLVRSKNRAKIKGVPFEIDLTDIKIPDRCPVLKKPFSKERAFRTSLDKIDPTKGYTKGNVQVMSQRANVMKNDASVEELRSFARWVFDTYGEYNE